MIYVDHAPLTSCQYHRIHLPFKFMTGLNVTRKLGYASVIVFNRIPSFDINLYKQKGVKIVMDIDDYWHLYPEHPLYKNWRPERYINLLKSADLVTCTTSLLADKIKPLNKNVEVLPNALPYGKDQFEVSYPKNTNKFGYVGGNSHVLDVQIVAGIKVPAQRPIGLYMQMYRGLNMTYAPLIDNEFNRCKSNLKALESGCVNAALMASRIPPYLNDIDKDYVIYCNENEWPDKIKYCLFNPNYVKDMGLKLGEHVRNNYDLADINELRRQLLERL